MLAQRTLEVPWGLLPMPSEPGRFRPLAQFIVAIVKRFAIAFSTCLGGKVIVPGESNDFGFRKFTEFRE